MVAPATVTAEDRARLRLRVEDRCSAGDSFFASNAVPIAECAAAMADRFFQGAMLLVMGSGRQASDARHNAVEYVHPALAGCRALPAVALSSPSPVFAAFRGDGATGGYAHQVATLARRDRDIVLAFCGPRGDPEVVHAVAVAGDLGLLTIVLTSGARPPAFAAGHVFAVATDDEPIAQEIHQATYHMLWELVHIALNHRGIAGGGR